MLIKNISQQKIYLGPGELKCQQVQREVVLAGQWKTIFNISDGPAVVTNFWFAHNFGGQGRLTPIRFYFDGAVNPQIEGFTGELFASGFDVTVKFRNHYVGVSMGESSAFSGYLKLLMPYYSSIRIDVKNNSAGGGDCWAMLERMPITKARLKVMGLGDNMLLRTYGYGLDGWKNKYTEITLLDQSGPTILTGLFHFFKNSEQGGSNWYFLEGDYKIYYGGSPAASYRSSGTEDFHHSSWYFSEGAFAEDDECMQAKNNADYSIAMSRFFPLWRAPYHSNGLKLTWQVGESESGYDPGARTYTRWIVWYYK